MMQSEQDGDGGVSSSPTNTPQSPMTASQLFFLQRLAWLQKQRRECINVLHPSDWRMRLLNKALYSTYRDCVAAGVEQAAKEILQREQPSN
jgi:hypothetical protein